MDFVDCLAAEFNKRKEKNPSYSLRSFARSLGIDPSFLSKILKRKRLVTETTVVAIGPRISLSAVEIQHYKHQARPAQTKKKSHQIIANPISADEFKIISDWYHFAILELPSLIDFESNVNWVANCLGINKTQAAAAIERLLRLGLLKTTTDGKWINSRGNNSTLDNANTVKAFKKMQKQVLLKSIKAMEEFPIEIRDHATVTLAIPSNKIAKAKKMLATFRRRFAQTMQDTKSNNFDEVYNLSISFYPLRKQDRSGSVSLKNKRTR